MNWAISIAVFIPLVFILQNLLPLLVADAIAVGVVFILFFFFLRKRILGILCTRCEQYIETNTPWLCSLCGTKNIRAYDFPFVNCCEGCGWEPKAYKCHHCGEMIFLSDDKNKINYAQCINLPDKPKPVKIKKDRSADDIAKQSRDIQVAELNLKKAKLDLELKGVKEYLEPKKEMTQEEILWKSAQEYLDRNMSGPKIVEILKARNAKIFKDNPVELEKANLVLQKWARDHVELF